MKRVTAFAVLLVILATPVWAGWDEGFAGLKNGDYATALREFRPLAQQGHAKAQYRLGNMYEYGQGVPQNSYTAAKWLRKAAEQGHVWAQYNLGHMYFMGQGVALDEVAAARWYKKAAEQGNANAEFALAMMYSVGQGVPQDDAKAVKLYRKVAEIGDYVAQAFLASMYQKGHGVPRDYVQALMWHILAVAGSPLGVESDSEKRYWDSVVELMTPAQIANAQRLAREWRPRG